MLLARIACFLISVLPGITVSAAQSNSPAPILAQENSSDIKERKLGGDMLPFELTRDSSRLVKVTSEEKRRHDAVRRSGGLKFLKLFSAPACASKRYVVDVSETECRLGVDNIRTSFYSLALGLYGESLSDIRIVDGVLHVGNDGMLHGMAIDLGKVDLAKLTKTSPMVAMMADIETASDLDQESEVRKKLNEGFNVGEFTVRSSVRLIPSHTYLLRTINYSYNKGSRSPFHRDVIYLLHFAESNPDGTALLLWRKLGDRAAPKL